MRSDETRSEQTAEFSLSYEGDALERHTMPVRDLAPALLALGQAFDRASSLLNGNRASVSLDIRATEQGSFEIVLSLQQLLDNVSAALSKDFLSSAVDLKTLLIGSIGGVQGLVALIKFLKGTAPREIARTDGNVVLEVGTAKLTVPVSLFRLYKDTNLRTQLEAVVRPLMRSGVDRLRFKERKEVIETIDKGDLPSFTPEDVRNASEIVIPQQRLKIISPNFEGGKWRLSDGERARWYKIEDNDFAQDVERGNRAFRRGDILRCQVIMTQHEDEQGDLSLDYRISDVLGHESKPTQLHFDSVEETPPS